MRVSYLILCIAKFMQMLKPVTAICLSALCCLAARADGGVSLNQTRVIFQGGSGAQNVTVNNQGDRLYLLQSGIQLALEDPRAAPFMVTPPLARLAPDSSNTLRILKQGNARLPEDRESLFYLSVLAIPARPGEDALVETARLSMGLRFMLKLFYRPHGLKLPPEQTYCQLQVAQNGHRVRITNPGPYFLTFSQLTLDNQPIDLLRQPSMIPPLGYQDYPTTRPMTQAHWQLITDYGGVSAGCQRQISANKEAQ